MLKPGLYEQVINKELSDKIDDSAQLIDKRNIDKAEAPQVLAGYLSEVIEKGLSRLAGDDIECQLGLANKIVSAVTELTGDEEFDGLSVDQRAEQLLAVANMQNNADAMKRRITMTRPETSLASSSLFTGAGHEPQMMTELKKEIVSADRIDMLVSFIKWSGLVLIIDELQEFTARGGQLRVITTSYMGATDVKAVEELIKLPHTEIKVSYDTERTRLHAKSYVFYRDTGFTTAYVGSSNMSNAAMTSGLEWNLKITAHDQPHTIRKINATFENYWNSTDFSLYSPDDRMHLMQALKAEKYHGDQSDYSFDIRPFSYQQEILDKLTAEREIRNHWKNLVVAATGTGKTVISAFDYRRFRQQNGRARLLFVWQKSYEDCGFSDLLEGFRKIAKSPVMLAEILELMYYKYDKIDFIDEPVQVDYDCPLDVHCSYTRDQILVALDFMKPDTVREGVKYLENKKTDLLFVTLNKSDKDYSPTTMYNDYSINSELFHWQSQSTTTPQSNTGQRYINHRKMGTSVMIFVREYKSTKLGAAPYTFLGLADYVKSEGSKPMNVVWKLRKPIPAKYLKKTNQLTVG